MRRKQIGKNVNGTKELFVGPKGCDEEKGRLAESPSGF